MTTTSADIFSTKNNVTLSDTDEKARRAVKAFRSLQPTLSAYARVLTKNPRIVVEMSSSDNGSTDGHKIYYRPPISLGEDVQHDRRLCDKRDADLTPLCRACEVREDTLVTIYHEIAHIAFDSFAETKDEERAALLERAIKEHGGRYAALLRRKIEVAPSYVKNSYIGMAGLISDFLPLLVNCLEDARVNREMFTARKGTKVMFDANTHRIFEGGVEQRDPKTGKIITVMWNEYPLNMQALVGVFCKASDYKYDTWFAPQVVRALDDAELTNLVNRMRTVRSAAGVYELSFPVLARLRELGFCKLPDDPEPEPTPEENDDAPQEEDTDQPDEADDDGGRGGDDKPDADSDGPASDGDDDPEGDAPESESEDEATTGEGTDASDGGEPDSNDDGDAGGTGAGEDSGDEERGEGSDGDGAEPEEAGADEPSDDAGDGAGAGDDGEADAPSDTGDGEAAEGAPGEEGDSEPGAGSAGDGAPVSPADGSGDDGDAGDGEPSDAPGAESEDGAGDGGDREAEGGEGDTDAAAEPDGEAGSPTAAGQPNAGHAEGDDRDGHPEGSDGAREDDAGAAPEGGAEADPAGPSVDGDSTEAVDDEVIDTGADNGTGGIKVNESDDPDLPMGTPDEVKAGLVKFGDHEEKPKSVDQVRDEMAVDKAIVQGAYFETPSSRIHGVREHRYGKPEIDRHGFDFSRAWKNLGSYFGYSTTALGQDGEFLPTESVLGPALLRMRVAFSDNQRGNMARHKRSGRINGAVLGKRAPLEDGRLFQKKTMPGKKDYFVLIGMDVSGSTVGQNIVLEKQAVMAQAELCRRMGIPFAIFAHSGNHHDSQNGSVGIDLDIYIIKEPGEVWDDKVKERLLKIGPDAANIDGHTMEYYRKVLDGVDATDKIIMYYTDGKMPAENYDEELEILQRELRICKQKGYTVMGVGIRTDSPVRHGLDTVQVDGPADVGRVVRHLEKRLTGA
jgi:hypothetical protein